MSAIIHEPLAARYARYVTALAGEVLPAAVVDLDALEHNLALMSARAGATPIRLATKSFRCIGLLQHVTRALGARGRGLMCYSAREAEHLAQHGFDDLFVAYPSVQRADVEALVRLSAAGRRVTMAVDSDAHLSVLADAARAASVILGVVIDLDTRLSLSGLLIGAKRSPLFEAPHIIELAERVRSTPGLSLQGIMAYEAHVAGLTDDNPFSRALNRPKRMFKALAMRQLRARRAAIASALEARGFSGLMFNGGGTATVHQAAQEPWLTEVTLGSGVLAPHLFDYHHGLRLVPAACFALGISRIPEPGHVTVLGGGFSASGEAGPDRLPLPYLPPGMRLVSREGAGEVQTPLTLPHGTALAVGAPVFFRHAKAGELAEHVREYLLVRGERIVDRAATYRGEDKSFL